MNCRWHAPSQFLLQLEKIQLLGPTEKAFFLSFFSSSVFISFVLSFRLPFIHSVYFSLSNWHPICISDFCCWYLFTFYIFCLSVIHFFFLRYPSILSFINMSFLMSLPLSFFPNGRLRPSEQRQMNRAFALYAQTPYASLLLSVVILCSIYFESVSPVVVVVVDFLRVLMKDVKATLLQDNRAVSVRNFFDRIS